MPKKSSPEPQSVDFDCKKCGKNNVYPASAVAGTAKDGATSLVKKCTFCGADNTITLPENFIFPRDAEIFRGD